MTWNTQKPLAERFTLVVPVRSGHPPNPKLVVSGAHGAAFDAVADVLERRLGAQRAVLPGAGHSIPRLGEPLNELLRAFASRAAAAP
jgi:hypothetical protein